jgi:hypothetical protein
MRKALFSLISVLAFSTAASIAQAHVFVSVGIPLPVVVVPPVVYYPPTPAYYPAPRTVYYAPPPPVYHAPRAVYSAPVYRHRHPHHHWR